MNAAGIVGGHLRRPGAVSFPSGSVEEREREREKKEKKTVKLASEAREINKEDSGQ